MKLAVIESLPRWFLFGHATEPGEIQATLRQAGWDLVETHDFLPRQSFVLAARPD